MTRHIRRPAWLPFTCSAMMLWALCLMPAEGQVVRVALQPDNAGESADDDPADTGDPKVVQAPQATDESTEILSPAEQAVALERRAGEQIGDSPQGRAMILGMHVQESDEGRVKVVDVAAASPAFDAGIRKGDIILSFDGFKGESYRDWIDGIRKLVTDTTDGEMVAVALLRDGERVAARIRTAIAHADDPRVPQPLGQQLPQAGQATPGAVPPGTAQPGGTGMISDDDVFINEGGFFGDQPNDDLTGTTDRAMAQIFRLNVPQQAAHPSADLGRRGRTAQQGAAGSTDAIGAAQQPGPIAGGQGGRIGLAGFRNEQNGMLVMLDVGGLTPGSYPVGIDDPALLMGAQAAPAGGARNDLRGASQFAPPQAVPGRGDGTDPPFPDRRITPQRTPQGDNQQGAETPAPQGQTQQPGTNQGTQATIPSTILAQVAEEGIATSATPQTGQVAPSTTPPTGQVNQSATPPTGQVLPPGAPPSGRVLPPGAPPTGRVFPSGTTPTGLPDPEGAQVTGTGRQGALNDGVATGGVGQPFAQIGTLVVDQSGTGRLQQVVGGLQVRDVVGQAIVIYAPVRPPETAPPPNTNVSGTRARGNPTAAASGDPTNPAAAAGGNPANPSAAAAANPVDATGVGSLGVAGDSPGIGEPRQLPGRAPQPLGTSGQIAGETSAPVAAGIIRLLSDRRPGGAAQGAAEGTTDQNRPGQQPAGSQQPAAGQQPAATQQPPATTSRPAAGQPSPR